MPHLFDEIPKGAPGYSWIVNRRFQQLEDAILRAGLQLDADGNLNLNSRHRRPQQ